MLVRQLIGPYAGQIVEMPFAVAQNCLAAGTAAKPEDTPRVKGLKVPDVDAARAENAPTTAAAPATVSDVDRPEIPDDWASLHHTKRKALAKQLTGEAFAKTTDADAAIRAFLAG